MAADAAPWVITIAGWVRVGVMRPQVLIWRPIETTGKADAFLILTRRMNVARLGSHSINPASFMVWRSRSMLALRCSSLISGSGSGTLVPLLPR